MTGVVESMLLLDCVKLTAVVGIGVFLGGRELTSIVGSGVFLGSEEVNVVVVVLLNEVDFTVTEEVLCGTKMPSVLKIGVVF